MHADRPTPADPYRPIAEHGLIKELAKQHKATADEGPLVGKKGGQNGGKNQQRFPGANSGQQRQIRKAVKEKNGVAEKSFAGVKYSKAPGQQKAGQPVLEVPFGKTNEEVKEKKSTQVLNDEQALHALKKIGRGQQFAQQRAGEPKGEPGFVRLGIVARVGGEGVINLVVNAVPDGNAPRLPVRKRRVLRNVGKNAINAAKKSEVKFPKTPPRKGISKALKPYVKRLRKACNGLFSHKRPRYYELV